MSSSLVPSSAEIDRWVEVAKKCEYLTENDLKVVSEALLLEFVCMCSTAQKLCDYVCDLLLEESNVQPVSTPITVCGDIHGQVHHYQFTRCPRAKLFLPSQFYDLQKLFQTGGEVPNTSYVFMVMKIQGREWPEVLCIS